MPIARAAHMAWPGLAELAMAKVGVGGADGSGRPSR